MRDKMRVRMREREQERGGQELNYKPKNLPGERAARRQASSTIVRTVKSSANGGGKNFLNYKMHI